jgi:hypothetical protein
MSLSQPLPPPTESLPTPEVRKTTPLDPAAIRQRLKELRDAKLLTEAEYQARIAGLQGEASAD